MLSVGELAMSALHRNAEAFATHATALRTGDGDPEVHVHQTRVATRRLRAALRLFGDLLPEDAAGLRDELKWIANRFSTVRDLDVQLKRLRDNAASLDICEPLGPYTAWLAAERGRGMTALSEALDTPRFQALEQRLDATREWHVDARGLDPGAQIKRAMAPVKKTVAKLHAPPAPTELHQVRIRAKRARYTVEFFEALYDKSASRVREALVAIQELLGNLQDSVVSGHHIDEAVTIASGAWPPRTMLALGRLQQHELQFQEHVKNEFPNAYGELKRAWRRFDPTSFNADLVS